MLVDNGTFMRARYLGGALGVLAQPLGVEAARRIANAKDFGQQTSWPVGYQAVTRALVPPLGTSGQLAVNARLNVFLDGVVPALGNMATSFAPEFSVSVAANVLSNMSATFDIETSTASSLRGVGSMAAVFDIISRPSANDISQEVWNSFAIEGGYSAADVMRIMLAALAGKVSGAAGTTITFRDTQDNVDRIVATVDSSGNRSSVTLNADP